MLLIKLLTSRALEERKIWKTIIKRSVILPTFKPQLFSALMLHCFFLSLQQIACIAVTVSDTPIHQEQLKAQLHRAVIFTSCPATAVT